MRAFTRRIALTMQQLAKTPNLRPQWTCGEQPQWAVNPC